MNLSKVRNNIRIIMNVPFNFYARYVKITSHNFSDFPRLHFRMTLDSDSFMTKSSCRWAHRGNIIGNLAVSAALKIFVAPYLGETSVSVGKYSLPLFGTEQKFSGAGHCAKAQKRGVETFFFIELKEELC